MENRFDVRHSTVGTQAELCRALSTSVDVVVWHRKTAPELKKGLTALSRTSEVQLDVKTRLDNAPVKTWLRRLPGETTRAWLQTDIEQLLNLFQRLVGEAKARVQLRTIRECSCPKFHVDSLGLRMLCTYAGPGTQWLREQDVERLNVSSIARPHAVARRVQPIHVMVMKGGAWPGNEGFGAVHRSPRITRKPRLVLTIDATPNRLR